MPRFIRIQNRSINPDSIAYVDFLDSGRAMICVRGRTQEKQHIPVEPQDAGRLRAILDADCVPDSALPATLPSLRSENSQQSF